VVAGVDWLTASTPARAIGHRAAAVNLSDLAAVGARPAVLLLALELPPDADADAVIKAAGGLRDCAHRFGACVGGGDVGFSPGPARWTVTALGELAGAPMRRDAARAGDVAWLVGEVGLAAVGLEFLRAGKALAPWQEVCTARHLWPEPQVDAGVRLQQSGARIACIDVSDGLGLDAARLAQASGVTLDLAVHPSPSLDVEACEQAGVAWRRACASGGDDYALLVVAEPDFDVAAWLRHGGLVVPVQRLGTASQAPAGHVALTVGGEKVPIAGFEHCA
jgi:thiamine-monophosphate kinase